MESITNAIANIKLIYHPTPNDPFLLQCDASNHAIGGVLYQLQYDKTLQIKQWKIIEFYSKQIEQRLQKHTIAVKEALALVYACNHWRHFLLRRKFYVDSDNLNLVRLFSNESDESAPNMRKQQIY